TFTGRLDGTPSAPAGQHGPRTARMPPDGFEEGGIPNPPRCRPQAFGLARRGRSRRHSFLEPVLFDGNRFPPEREADGRFPVPRSGTFRRLSGVRGGEASCHVRG